MKFAPVTLAVAASVAATAFVIPSFADAQSRGYRYQEADRYYRDACRERKRDGKVAGGVLGAIAGGVIGQQVDDGEGAVVGAIAGAAIGSNVGGKAAKANCDRDGVYWDRNATYGYDRSYYYRGRYDDGWYSKRNCRWARDWRGDYVRVCPDRRGRYRIAY